MSEEESSKSATISSKDENRDKKTFSSKISAKNKDKKKQKNLKEEKETSKRKKSKIKHEKSSEDNSDDSEEESKKNYDKETKYKKRKKEEKKKNKSHPKLRENSESEDENLRSKDKNMQLKKVKNREEDMDESGEESENKVIEREYESTKKKERHKKYIPISEEKKGEEEEEDEIKIKKNNKSKGTNKGRIKHQKKVKQENQSETESESQSEKECKKNDLNKTEIGKRKKYENNKKKDKIKTKKYRNDFDSEDEVSSSKEETLTKHKKHKGHKTKKFSYSESSENEESSIREKEKNEKRKHKKSKRTKKKKEREEGTETEEENSNDSSIEEEYKHKLKRHHYDKDSKIKSKRNKSKRHKKKHKDSEKESEKYESKSEEESLREKKRRNKGKKYYDNSSESECEKEKKIKNKKHKKSYNNSYSYSDSEQNIKKHRRKKNKKESDDSYLDTYDKSKKHKNKNTYIKHKRKKQVEESSSSEYDDYKKKNKIKKNYFSSDESSSSSSTYNIKNKYKDKSNNIYKEKNKKSKMYKKQESSSSESEEEEEIKKDLSETNKHKSLSEKNSDDVSSSENKSNDSDTSIQNNNLITEEKKEENVKTYTKRVEEIKFSIEKLKPKNQSGKFLMDKKNKNKNEQKIIQEIIKKFKNTTPITKKYTDEFKDVKKEKFFREQGFILTEKSMERLALLIHYILNGIPVLFEGNTGTSKTRTTLVACNYIKRYIKNAKNKTLELIRYNLSAETKIDDLIAKYVSDQKSFVGLTVKNGPYVDAYINGKIILFDEINLAPVNVLQCIQQSLDNGFLSVETNGRCLLKYEKNPNFALVATQNPNKGAFEGKRQELGPEFLSRFQKIFFPDILKDEMEEIALGLAANMGYLKKDDKDEEAKKQFIKDIVNLHFEWAKETNSQTDIQCFTIREIESVIQCLSNKDNKESPYDVIMTIYGGRFRQDKKDRLEQKLSNIESFKEFRPKKEELPKTFPTCFENKALIRTVNNVLLALRNKRNVIIVGNDESGLTQIAEWCSVYFNKDLSSKKINESFICFCSNNLECSDLIGTQKISDSEDENNEIIRFEPRFLYEAIQEGHCVVLDSINEAPSRVIERLNGLLDKKNSREEEVFDVPENSKEPLIRINKDFRIICTSNFDKINQISPAFVNRFEVIVLEDQLRYLDEDKFKDLIDILCKRYQEECYCNYKIRRKKIKLNEKKKMNKKIYDDPFGFDDEVEKKRKNKLHIDKSIELEKDILNHMYEKIMILKKFKNPNEQIGDESTLENSISDKEFDENSKKYLTISSIAKFCRTVIILINKFKTEKNISPKSIINFSFELLFEEHLSEENKEIQKFLIDELIEANKLINKNLGEEKYFFDKSESLKKFMIQVYACSLINQYLCIIGPPGIGKTIGARAFSYMREKIFGVSYESPFYMHTFNQFSRASDYFGISSLKDEKLVFRDGTLTKSIKQGNVFIGDEFNISSENCMKSIAPALELEFNRDIIIPGIENKISIDPDFFFIICQNTKNTFGRKDLPPKIKIKIKVINYPDRVKEEIENICESIFENKFGGRKQSKLTVEQARLCGDFMMLLNEKEVLTPWSLRDISKLFARINKQSLNPNNYKNLEIKENILFYVLSSVNDSLLNERLPVVISLLSDVFKLNKYDVQILSELYEATPTIKKMDNKIYIEKERVCLFYCNYNQDIYEKLNGLPSVLNALFKIIIASDDEPILISGPSSFKTFLAKLINKNEKSEVISLNSESTISQLIGSAILLTSEKAKNYYLMQIYEILQINNADNYMKDLDDFEKNKNKIKKNVEDFIKEKKIDKNHTFNYALEHFKEKLFEEEKDKKSLFDLKIEFKPGIFISARIKGYNLILKNITKVKTENLERLNEALTGNKKITLNEDTQNSFTPENNKEINFSNNLRVIGTCNEGEETSLSDAFLSRFTLIYVDKYKNIEESKVLKHIAEDAKDIQFLNKLLEIYYGKFNDVNKMNLSQKINCFKIAKELDKLKQDNSHQQNLNLTAYYLLKGLTENREEKINEINNIFNINTYFDNNIKKAPIEIIKNYNKSFLKSKLSGLTMTIMPNQNKIKNANNIIIVEKPKINFPKLIFTNKIKEILDAIHFGIYIGVPIVLEGEYGQGKKSALEYYARQSELDLIQVQISKSTKVDDLLCKMTFKKNSKGNFSLVNSKTPLCKAIECVDNFPNKLVVIEGINNASPAILEVLNLIYGPKGTNILLPNGSTIVKGNMNLISIFNPSDDFPRERLTGNLINNSLYFIVESPTNTDINNIISNLFNEAGLHKDEQIEFTKNFLTAQKIAKEGIGEYPITLNEVKKYISFRKSIPDLDKKIFMLFIFNYHFSQKENIYKIKKELKLDTLLYNPSISYERKGNNKYLIYKSSKKGNRGCLKIELKRGSKIKNEECIKKFDSMTLTEKICFLFLLCCIKSKKTPIIQGVTSSGKSYIIKQFADILGQDLSIYQLNANSGLSLFTGQSVIKEDFDNIEKEKLKKILKLLKKEDKTIENLNSEDFYKFKLKIKKKLSSEKLSNEAKKEYRNAKDILSIMQSPLNRFMHKDSELITGIKSGKWIALDGTEMASGQISEKLSSLCSEVPSLNIFESGFEDLNFDSSNINENFRLFIIHNPSAQNAKKIDQSLFNKCVKFTLSAIDSNPIDATTMLYESISYNSNIEEDSNLWLNLCARIAKYHIEKSKLSKENTDLIAGNVPFTARNLSFISNDFHKSFDGKNIEVESWLQGIFENYYWRSFINYSQKGRMSFIDETLNIIKGVPEQNYKVIKKFDFNEESKEIIEDLFAIQTNAGKNIEFRDFFFAKFLNKCLRITINKEKLTSIYNHLEDTILLLDNNNIMDEILKNNFYQILFIKNNYENILNNYENINSFEEESELINEQLLKYENIKLYLLRMKFLYIILSNNNINDNFCIYESNLNYKLFNSYSNELSRKLISLIKYKNKSKFLDLVIYLFENPEVFKIIENYYPYNIEELKSGELKFSNYYIYLWTNLFKKKYNFSVRIADYRYNIIFPNEEQDEKLNPYFIFNVKNSLLLSKNSFLKRNKKKNDEYKYQYLYLKEEDEKDTLDFIQLMFKSYDKLYSESPLKTFEEIDNFQTESFNFFVTNNSANLISRIWSLIINLTDKFPDVINYFKRSFSFLENDAIEIFQYLYNKLDNHHLKDLIDNMKSISFFCDSDSILWKYRNLVNHLYKLEEININKYYDNFKKQNINPDEEIELIKKEIENIDKLIIYWDDKKIADYKGKLLTLQNLFITYKNKGIEDAEITKLRNAASSLVIKLDKVKINNDSNNKSLFFLKMEITKFQDSSKPTKESFKILESKVNTFLDVIDKKNYNKQDNMFFPKKLTDTDEFDIMKKFEIYNLILWFSYNDEEINKLLSPETDEKDFIEISMNLFEDTDLDQIISFINEKKIELNKDIENKNITLKEKQQIKQMLRGQLLCKMREKKINLNDLNNFVKNLNSKINFNEEISRDEYLFPMTILEQYPTNLKIIIPFFEPLDAFYLFYKYDKNQKYKLCDFFKDKNFNFGGINDIALTVLEKNNYKNMIEVSDELCKFFYESICIQKYINEKNLPMIDFLKLEVSKQNIKSKKDLLLNLISSLEYIYELNKIYENQKKNAKDYEFELYDFYNLLNSKKKLMNCSDIFMKEKQKYLELDLNYKSFLSPSLIFFANNNQDYINELFTNINTSDKSIIKDLEKNNKINYVPFWLFIIRNLSALNCLEYGANIDKSISNDILDKIKNKIYEYSKDKTQISLHWLNLISDNLAPELLEPNIHSFYILFNALINNLNVNEKLIKKIILDELKKYYFELIDLAFERKLDELLELDIIKNDYIFILKFTKDPASYIYEKLNLLMNNKFIDAINSEFYNLTLNFYDNSNKLKDNLITKVKIIDSKLFDDEFQKLKNIYDNQVDSEINELIEKNKKNLSIINKILASLNTNKQIPNKFIEELKDIHNQLSKYKKEFKKNKDGLICYELKYDFTKIKDKEYLLLYKNKEVELDKCIGTIFIIKDLNANLKNDFYLKVEDSYNEDKVEDFIKFDKKKEFEICEFTLENVDMLKRLIEKGNPKPTKKNVTNPPKILFEGYESKEFFGKVDKFESSVKKFIEILNDIMKNRINKNLIAKFEEEIRNIKRNFEGVKSLIKLNRNDFEDLNQASKEFDKEITEYKYNVDKYYLEYEKKVKNYLEEYFKIDENNIFNSNFALPKFPTNSPELKIDFSQIKKNSENLCVPIINIDTKGNNLICSYKSLELNLGKICPIFYEKHYTINIFSFVNEDLKLKIKNYKKEKYYLNNNFKENIIESEGKNSDKIEEEEKKEKEKEKKLENELKKMEAFKYAGEEEITKKLLSLKEIVKKGENIEIYVQIPKYYEEDTIRISSIIEIQSTSMKKLELETNIILTTIPVSCTIECKEYGLIKQEIKNNNSILVEHCFKLNTQEILADQEINFELINNKNNEPIEFYLSAKSLDKNTSDKPSFIYNIKQKNKFKLNIPKYDYLSKDNEIPRLNCIIEILINKNFVIYIMIDALIRPNLNILTMYDYFTKTYVKDECTIYLNESSQNIFKKENIDIELNFILYSTMENTKFTVIPDIFNEGTITSYKDGIIKKDRCNFRLYLKLDKDCFIKNKKNCNIKINELKINFKIKFSEPNSKIENIFSEDYFSHFRIKGKNDLESNWQPLSKEDPKTDYYVTPFNYSKIEIDIKNVKKNNIRPLIFYYFDSKNLNITEEDPNKGWFSSDNTPIYFVYKNSLYPLILRKYSWDVYEEINNEGFKWDAIKIQISKNEKKFLESIKHIGNAYNEILELKYKYELEYDDFYYKKCQEIIGKNISLMIDTLNNSLINLKYNSKKDEITFENLCYHIINDRTYKLLYSLNSSLPKSLQDYLKADYDNYIRCSDKDISLYNYLVKLNNIFKEQETKLKKLSEKKISINIPGIEKEQKDLLFQYYSINENEIIEEKLNIFENYEKQSKDIKKQEIREISSNRFLIIGDDSKPIDKLEKPKDIEDTNNPFKLTIDNSIQIDLPEISISDFKKDLTLLAYSELYNNCIICSRILPAYLYISIISDNKENIINVQKYFEILFAIYKNKKDKESSFIFEKINEFIISFEDMVFKLKEAGINFKKCKELMSIKRAVVLNSFIKSAEKIEPMRKNIEWENKKLLEQRKEQEVQNKLNKKIEIDNIKADNIRNIDLNMSNIKQNDQNSISIDLNSTNNNIQKNDSDEKDIKLEELLDNVIEEDDLSFYDEDPKEGKKIEENKIAFASAGKGKDNPLTTTSKEGFENLEKKFNEDYALKYIVERMKNKINQNDLFFKYESLTIAGYVPEKNNLYHNMDSEIKENEKLPIYKILENSRFLSSLILANISQINFNEGKDEIVFGKIEANIIVDLARTISNENRYFNMLMVCGLATALSYISIPYALFIIGDSNMKVRIKSIDEPHSELILQKLYDCCFIKRNVTQLPTCLRYLIDNYPAKDESIYRVYYIFTNGFDDELKKYKAWQTKIFNDKKNSFAFIFTKSKILEKKTNAEYANYLENIWNEFTQESKNSNSYVTVTKVSFKNLDKLEELTENMCKILLREKSLSNKDNSPKFNSLFSIDNNKSLVLSENYINLFRSLMNEQFNKDEFNEIYVKKNKLPFIYDTQKDNQKYFKIFCQKTGKMIRYDKLDIEARKNIIKLVREFKEKKEKLKLNPMNIIFKPNLPTQAILVEEGTHLDITELIKYSINKTPNPRLYREVRDGLIKNYGVSIVIDTSISCLNELCLTHTIQTLRILLNALSYDNIPCLDIIITRQNEPIILCSEKSANEILAEKSPFWPVLFSCLKGELHSDLASGIKAAYNLNRARRKDYTNYIFVLTDGMYCPSQRDRIIGVVNSCYSKNINIFGIGVGIYPIGNEKLFPQVIYCQNPHKLMEGISLCFGDISKYKNNKMKSFIIIPNIDNIIQNCSEIPEHIKNPKFKHLKDELSKIKITLESFPFFNPELEKNDDDSNPEGKNSGMYEKDFYKGQKILFAMFFSSDLRTQGGESSFEDEKKIVPNNVKNKIGDEECIASVLEYYGYEVILVTNYEDAINELCKQNIDKKCFYNSLWVISGQEVPDLPSNNGDVKAPYYVEQFVECAIQFWKNGGSLVLMGENDPHNFQINLFLKKLVFPGNKKLHFKIAGNHYGRKIMKADKSGKLLNSKSFNSKIQEVNNVERKSIANNLVQIFEGATVAYAQGDISPFIPFSRDSDGGINSLFYNGEDRGDGTGEGDIFIDCAYTKFFLDMKKTGTSRYLQNIGGFIGSAERRFKIGEHPRLYRPDPVFYSLKKNSKFHYKYPIKKFDIVYLVDATGSMGGSIESVKNYCIDIADILKKKMILYDFKFGAVFYRDPIDAKNDINEYCPLTWDVENLRDFVSKQMPKGGGDTPEDWVGGYKLALNNMEWNDGKKLIIHIADAGAHGADYSSDDNYPDEGPKLDQLIKQAANQDIAIVAFKIGSEPEKSFSRGKSLYERYGNNNYKIKEFDQNKKDPGYFTDLVVDAVIKVT